MRILVAEDDLTSRTILAGIIGKLGYEALMASDGGSALEIMTGDDVPEMAVIDWIMPVMDGIEVCRKIRSKDTEQPPYIIMLTGKDRKRDIVAGLEAGANDYISKPYDLDELKARIEVGRRMISIQKQLAEKIVELKEALGHIKTLKGIVPICASCKKIRDDKGYWEQVEVYVKNHSEAQFSHGICPDCIKKLYPDL